MKRKQTKQTKQTKSVAKKRNKQRARPSIRKRSVRWWTKLAVVLSHVTRLVYVVGIVFGIIPPSDVPRLPPPT